MKDLYLVIRGVYSDWSIEGYFETREEAEQYVIQDRDKDEWHEPYIEVISQMDEVKEHVDVLKHHEIVFYFKNGSRKDGMRNEPGGYNIYTGKKKKTTFYTRYGLFTIETTQDSREKAEKIAQDYFAEFLSLMAEYGQAKAIELLSNKITLDAKRW